MARTILYMDFDGVPGLSELAEPDIQIGQYTLLFKKKKILIYINMLFLIKKIGKNIRESKQT